MRVEIRTQPPGPLRVLKSLPDSRLAMLEGLNGIGKTLSIRLLQLCTGESPYRTDSPAWKSLCDGLGEFSVTISHLAGAERLEWEGDSSDWLHAESSAPVPFRSIRLDGQPTTMEVVRGLLRVHRLAGDEDLLETLAQQADHAAEVVRHWTARFADPDAGPLASLEDRLGLVAEAVGEWSAERLEERSATVQVAADRHEASAAEVSRFEARRDAFRNALRTHQYLLQLEGDLPRLQAEAAAVDVDIGELRDQLEGIYAEITQLAGRLAAAEPVARELRNARRTLARNHEKLAAAADKVAALAADLSIETTARAVQLMRAQVDADIEAATALQHSLDQAPAMRDLLDTSIEQLAAAEANGLADQVLIDEHSSDLQLTVAEAHHGMAGRRGDLEGQPPPPEAEAVSERLSDLLSRRTRLIRLEDLRQEELRYRRLVRENEDRVDAALRAFDPDASSRLQELEDRRRQGDERLLDLAATRARLRQQLGGLTSGATPDQAAEDLRNALDSLGVEAQDLELGLSASEEALSAALVRHDGNSDQLRAARREFRWAESELARISALLASDEQLDWLRAALPQAAFPPRDGTPPQQAASIGEVGHLCQMVLDRMGDLRSQLGAIQSGLLGIARRLRNQELQTARYVPQLEAWLGHHFSEWFNEPRVRAELLPDADGPVVVDLSSLQVKWTSLGKDLARPLEAFSSGEQAFAYTRARIAILDEEREAATNRLIVLDEFGAFIAHDRLSGLLHHLQDRAPRHPNDQVLVILPLTQNYGALATTAMGEEALRLGSLADQIALEGYAYQDLVP